MTRDEFASVMEAVRSWWPQAPQYRPDTLTAWFDALRWHEAADVRAAWHRAWLDGTDRPPNAGQISRKLQERGKDAAYAGEPCRCYETGYDGCPSTGHPHGWMDRQRKRDWAVGLVERHGEMGIPVNPYAYGADSHIVAAALLAVERRPIEALPLIPPETP